MGVGDANTAEAAVAAMAGHAATGSDGSSWLDRLPGRLSFIGCPQQLLRRRSSRTGSTAGGTGASSTHCKFGGFAVPWASVAPEENEQYAAPLLEFDMQAQVRQS